MAKERVQVQGLGDVAPGITPTIQRAGQYSVAQLRAAPVQAPRSKLLDLAEALGTGQQLLQQYGQAAEQEAQLFEEELARKSPEEVQAMLKQTEGELDKQVRRGAMGWLTSPLNQKRKMQAVGALLHDDYERQLKAQVQDPANADADINELIAGVKDNLRNQYGSLQSTFVNEGFEGAIRETTRRYTLAHDSLSTAQARSELNRAGKSVLFNASTLVNGEIADPEAITNWWADNEGAFTPSELKKLRDDVVLLHASRGNFEAAREFQEYTSNLKAGTTKMGDPDIKEDDVFGMYSAEEAALRQTIDDMELKSDERLVASSKQELREYDELAIDIGLAIRTNPEVGYTTKEGTVIKTIREAETYLLEKLQKSDNILVRGSNGVSVVQNALKSLELPKDFKYIQFGENYGRAEINKGPNSFKFGYESILQDFKGSYAQLDSMGSGRYILDPKYETLANNLIAEIYNKRALKMEEISTGTFMNVDGEEIISSKFKDQADNMKAWDRIYLKEFKDRLFAEAPELKVKIETAEEIKTPVAEETDPDAFVEPGKKLSDFWFIGKPLFGPSLATFPILEKRMRDGDDFSQILTSLERTREEGIIAPFSYSSKLGDEINILKSNKATPEQQQAAKNKISLYILAKGLYTAENIRNGSVTLSFGGQASRAEQMLEKYAIEGGYEIIERAPIGKGVLARVPTVEPTVEEISIDKASIKKLVDIYPLIPKARLIEIASTEPDKFPEEQALFEAIYDVELDENNEQDRQLLEAFIKKQAELSQRIYKN
jgi:hypothetical protein